MRVNRRLGLEETVFRYDIGQVQIRLVKSANRSDVLPVSLINKRADMPVFDCVWDDVFSKINQIIFQTFNQHLAIEYINSHRRLVKVLFFGGANRSQQLAA